METYYIYIKDGQRTVIKIMKSAPKVDKMQVNNVAYNEDGTG